MQTKPVNIESKNNLARLLATENIWIQHRQVDTASFDLKNRVLTFPMWKEMSSALYTMLAGHEVGHALYSEKSSVIDIGKRIDPKNPGLAGAYWNIVEDARIERLIKDTYPGLIRQFAESYKDLTDRDFFGLSRTDPQSLPFIDRLNLQFKIGHLIDLQFTPTEQVFVNKVRNTVTMEDVVEVAKEIYEFSKHEHTPPEQLPDWIKELLKNLQGDCDNPSSGDGDDENEGSASGENESDGDQNDDSNGSGQGDEAEGEGENEGQGSSGEGDEEASGDGQGKGGDQEGEDEGQGGDGEPKDGQSGQDQKSGGAKESSDEQPGQQGQKPGKEPKKAQKKDGKGGKSKQAATGKDAADHVDPGPPPDPYTQRTFDEKLKTLLDKNAAPVEYVTLPKPNLDKILVPYAEVHLGIRKHNFAVDDYNNRNLSKEEKEKKNQKLWAEAEASFLEFRKANVPKVNYIFQQFMMKKQADRYKRTRQHKTGSLDPLRLHAYKIDEDLFKTIAIVSDDKNHGLIFVIDWTGSMQSSMAGTLEQLISLCMFCRKANIPFEVYSFTTGGQGAFSREPGNIVYADNFRMRCYLSSRMSSRQFYDACVDIFMLMPNGSFRGGPTEDNLIGCTPLDESIIATIDLIERFRRQTKAQIVNAIFMTDGDANTVNGYYNSSGRQMRFDGKTKYLIDDRKTHKVYEFSHSGYGYRSNMIPVMLNILRDRQNINVVGFFVGGHWQGFFEVDDKKLEELEKQFNQDGYVVATAWGFNELYITKAGEDQWRVKEMKLTPTGKNMEKGTDKYDDKLGENFTKKLKTSMKKRVMLDRFVKMIA